MKSLTRRCLLALTLAFVGTAGAQTFPSRSVRIVVGLEPGGGTDTIARMIGQKLSTNIGQPVLVENRPGASGNIAAEYVARAAPDGYTLVLVTASHVINPALYAKLSYDPFKDFTPVTQITAQPYLVVVPQALPVNNLAEFIALAKSRNGGLSYASSGAGLIGHLAMEMLKNAAGFQATHIPYKGAGPALVGTIAGQTDAFLPTIISGLPQVKNGKLRAIAVTSLERSPLVPNVPTVAEQGFPGFEASGWYGLLAPAGVPKDVLTYLNTQVVKVLRDPEIAKKIAGEGATGVGNTPEEFTAYMRSEADKWRKVVRLSGATAN